MEILSRQVAESTRAFVDSIIPPSTLAIGKVVTHPSRRRVQIRSGVYWTPGGLSNFWTWQEVNADGTLNPLVESGYGWM